MAWRSITEDDVLQQLSGDELAALREAALGDGQDDPVADQVDQVADLVRGYIAANVANTLGEAATIPERLIHSAVAILVVDINKRAGGLLIDPNDARADARKEATRLLERVADGKFSVEQPSTAGDETEASVSPAVDSPTRLFTDDNQDGI